MTGVGEFVERWPAEFARPDPETNRQRRWMVAGFGREFSDRPLDSLTRAEAYAWAVEHPAAARYVRELYSDAIRVGLVDDNPFWNLRVGSSVGRAYAVIPTLADVAALEKAAPAKIRGMVTFAAYTGLRLGEQLALRRCDVDGDVCRVEAQLDRRGERKPLKGGARPRGVLIPEEASRALRRPRSASGRLWPISRWQHFRAWDATRKALGVEFDWHELRHVAATRWVEAGASTRDVAYMLGHRDDTRVRRLYARHVDEAGALERMRAVG